MNVPAGPRLADLVRIARDAHAASGRDPARFLVTASARPSETERARLAALGVDRMVVGLGPPYADGVARVRAALPAHSD
jgi:hypothetical protein